MKYSLAVLSLLILIACGSGDKPNTWNLRGTWYYNAIDGGTYDSLTHYVEVYVLDDSTIQIQGEDMGATIRQRFYVKNDTLFKCYSDANPCMYDPIFRLNKKSGDTLWLSMNPQFTKRNPEIYWIRISKDETGPSDYQWTETNIDSLNYKMLVDYDRRKFKFYLTRSGRLNRYDSLVKAGMWKWNMKQRR